MRNKKWIALLLAVCTLIGSPGFIELTYADKQSEAEDKKNQANNELNNIGDKIDDIKDNQLDIKDDINTTRKKLNNLLALQEELALEISTTQNAIEETQKELDAAQADADKQYEAMVLRIQYMYENSAEDSLWEAILKADGVADLLNRVEYIAQVHKTDRELMTEYQAAVDLVIAQREALVAQMETLVAKEEIYIGQQKEIETALADLKEVQAEYAAQLAAAQKKATELKATIAEQEKIIAAEIKRKEEERKKKEEEEKKKQEEALKKNTKGSDIVKFARKYVGNPYVWGGNSLTKGCDCSGFVHLVYKNFGFNLPRYSMSFLNVGTKVEPKLSALQPGDIIIYNKHQGVGHVAIYIGNGKIVEAQSSKAGITDTRAWNCRSIAGVRRIVTNP